MQVAHSIMSSDK